MTPQCRGLCKSDSLTVWCLLKNRPDIVQVPSTSTDRGSHAELALYALPS